MTRLRVLTVLSALILACSASAFVPRTGHWYSPSQSGTGYNIDIQNGIVVLTLFSYKADGDSEWYLASGPLDNTGKRFTAPLERYRNGQCVSCDYREPVFSGDDGDITVNFISETAATVRLGARSADIEPFNFGFGPPPGGLLGQWVFVETIGSSDFADRYTFASTTEKTANGNGMVIDLSRNAACEYQVSGGAAGYVICVRMTSSGSITDQYVWRFGLDQTYEGYWVSPSTLKMYPMKGFLVRTAKGQASGAPTDAMATADRADEQHLAKLAAEAAARDADAATAFAANDELAQALRRLISRPRP